MIVLVLLFRTSFLASCTTGPTVFEEWHIAWQSWECICIHSIACTWPCYAGRSVVVSAQKDTDIDSILTSLADKVWPVSSPKNDSSKG